MTDDSQCPTDGSSRCRAANSESGAHGADIDTSELESALYDFGAAWGRAGRGDGDKYLRDTRSRVLDIVRSLVAREAERLVREAPLTDDERVAVAVAVDMFRPGTETYSALWGLLARSRQEGVSRG